MPTFGAHAMIWVADWDSEAGGRAIESAARAGADLIEIPMLHPERFDAKLARKQLQDNGLQAACSLVLPREAHMPAHPQQAIDFLHSAIDQVAAVGSGFLGGVLYGHLGFLTGAPPTDRERETCAGVLADVAAYAKSNSVKLALEPVNRYETYLFNTIADTIGLIKATGSDNIVIHADTYHMNIEEPNFKTPVVAAGPHLAYIHCSESDRGVPGQGNVHWDDLFAGLAEIDFRGPLVLESFAAINPDLAGATCMWRKPTYTSDQLAIEGIAFLREKAAAYGLK